MTMNLRLKELSVGSIDLPEGDHPSWVQVFIHFQDEITECHPSVDVRVPIPCKSDWTIQKLKDEALRSALEIIKHSEAILEGGDK